MKKKILFFTALLSLIVMNSCVPEYQLARHFINTKSGADLLIIPPDYIFKTNLNKSAVSDTANPDQDELFEKSTFLQYLSDSIFIESYINNLINECDKLGFRTYLYHFPDYLMTEDSSNALVYDVAQLEVEENIYTFRNTETISGLTYYKDLDLNQVEAHFWIELSRADRSEFTNLYHSQLISDIPEGFFNQNVLTGSVSYYEDISRLKTEDIYSLSEYLGKLHAEYLFDFFMNNYILRNFPENKKLRHQLHYNPDKNVLRISEDEGFIIINEKN